MKADPRGQHGHRLALAWRRHGRVQQDLLEGWMLLQQVVEGGELLIER